MSIQKRLGRRRPQADLLEGELSKEWVLSQILHCLEKKDGESTKQIADLQRQLEVTKQTLAVAITELITTKQVLLSAAELSESLPTSTIFQMIMEGLGIFNGADALRDYILRFNGLNKDTPVNAQRQTTGLTAEQIALDDANARMAASYVRALEIEARRDQLLERVAIRIATNNSFTDPLEQMLIDASREADQD